MKTSIYIAHQHQCDVLFTFVMAFSEKVWSEWLCLTLIFLLHILYCKFY